MAEILASSLIYGITFIVFIQARILPQEQLYCLALFHNYPVRCLPAC